MFCPHHYNTPSFNLTLSANLSHYELKGAIVSGISNMIFTKIFKFDIITFLSAWTGYYLVRSATKIVTCRCHVDDSTEGRYDMVISRDLLTLFIFKNALCTCSFFWWCTFSSQMWSSCMFSKVDTFSYLIGYIVATHVGGKNQFMKRKQSEEKKKIIALRMHHYSIQPKNSNKKWMEVSYLWSKWF